MHPFFLIYKQTRKLFFFYPSIAYFYTSEYILTQIISYINLMRFQEYTRLTHPTPRDFLQKLETPHSVINYTSSEDAQSQINSLEDILNISYNLKSTDKNQKALAQLKSIVNQWLYSINPNMPKKCGLYIFGSYKLGASSSDGDIDAVCVVPQYVNRQKHFFMKLVGLLQERFQKQEQKQQIFKIPMALVPLIKVKFHGIEFDILMCQINEQILISQHDFLQSKTPIEIEQKQLKNINGCRVASYFINNITNYQYFKVALKAIKMWAKNKGIYQQIFCYLGGIGYTILLAKICQLYPNYPPLKLLDRFFYIYSRWIWQIPVILEECKEINLSQRFQMTIMTPINPSMNAAHGVCKSTLKVMKKQLKSASKLLEEIKQGRRKWNQLFIKSDFFGRYKYKLEISIMANKKVDFIPWKGYVESKFRKLMRLLQNHENSGIIELNPYPKQFMYSKQSYKYCSKYYIGIRSKSYSVDDDNKEIDFTQPIKLFLEYLQNYNQIEKFPDCINIGVNIVGKDDISEQIIRGDSFYEYYL